MSDQINSTTITFTSEKEIFMSVQGTCDQKYSLQMDPVSNTNTPFRFCTYASSSFSCDCNEDKK